jgi:hypothetical protein
VHSYGRAHQDTDDSNYRMSRPSPVDSLGPITLGLHFGWRIAGLAVAAAGALGGRVCTVVHILVAMRNTMHKARARTARQPALWCTKVAIMQLLLQVALDVDFAAHRIRPKKLRERVTLHLLLAARGRAGGLGVAVVFAGLAGRSRLGVSRGNRHVAALHLDGLRWNARLCGSLWSAALRSNLDLQSNGVYRN